MSKKNWSWGNYPKAEHNVAPVNWLDFSLPKLADEETMLPHGNARSYGDVPINNKGTLLHTKNLSRLISFDETTGILTCEAGVTLGKILEAVVSKGWFLPVTPGTQFATVGGAIANDVHGKNHHVAGTFGDHVLSINMLRSDQGKVSCSHETNSELFKATIAGLGLTGLILSAEIQLIKINNRNMDIVNIAFENVDHGLDLFEEHDSTSTYTVAWIDCLSTGDNMGRGIFTRAEHSRAPAFPSQKKVSAKGKKRISVPVNFPSFALNNMSVKAFNELYYRKGKFSQGPQTVDYQPFFYPLDGIENWNKIYGKQGFFQYQCVVPSGASGEGRNNIKKLLGLISESGNASFLAVLKRFGDVAPAGMLSFPAPGITLALDFPNKGHKVLALMEALDDIVKQCGGKVYPAKDARMAAASFKQYYPNWESFASFIDPSFSSSFWRRVTGEPS